MTTTATRTTTTGSELEQRYAEQLAARRALVNAITRSPATLAKALDPRFRIRPHTRVIADAFLQLRDHDAGTDGYDRILITTPPQIGKLVADDTPVPTTAGWKRHGDLRVGDQVIHPSGKPTRVVAVHEPDMASMVVRTRSGAALSVHPRHEWTVYDRHQHEWVTLEAQELLYGRRPGRGRGWSRNTHTWGTRTIKLRTGGDGRGGRWRFQLPWQDAFDLPAADLPVDPYTLGVWLGDGSTTKPAITHDPADVYELPYPVTSVCQHATTGVLTTYYGGDLFASLLALGVATRDYGVRSKHIPDVYLRAADEQRWDLLCGLVDSDGTITAEGQVTITGSDQRLMCDVAELVRTFGYRPTVRAMPPTTSSSGIVGTKWVHIVQFTPHDGRYPARLKRKLEGLREGKARSRGAVVRRRDAITSVEHCSPRPGRCITVAADDGLYLVGEHMIPTHNSICAAVWAPLWWLIHHPTHRIVIASYSGLLAKNRGRVIRDTIAEHGHEFGLQLADAPRGADDWSLTTGAGVRSVGVGGGLTGHSADMLITDDPIADREEAESLLQRDKVHEWWSAVAMTRLSPGAPVVLILTRWHENDLAGRLLASEGRVEDGGRWKVIHLPAIADTDLTGPDALGRTTGEPLTHPKIPTSDKTALLRHWNDKQASVSMRDWHAMFQGDPKPIEGALVTADLLRARRHIPPPPDVERQKYAVAVDPAAGGRDLAGIIGGWLGTDGRLYLSHDRSLNGYSTTWAMEAALLAAEQEAEFVVFEKSGLLDKPLIRTAFDSAWDTMQRLNRGDHRDFDDPDTARRARELPGIPAKPLVKIASAKKGKLLRAEPVAQQWWDDRMRTSAYLPATEAEWCRWMPTDPDSPGRIDASVYLACTLLQIPGAEMTVDVSSQLTRQEVMWESQRRQVHNTPAQPQMGARIDRPRPRPGLR